jgi:PAS domain S-box-containing protein
MKVAMTQKKTAQEKFNQLRRQAEEILGAKDFVAPSINFDDPLKLIHELQTFQIEMELQIEELNRSQQELMEIQRDYTQLYDFAPVGYITLNSKGLILKANLTLADMLLAQRGDLINHPLSAHILFNDQDIYYHHLKDLSRTKTRQICELRMKRIDGIPFYVQMESIAILDKENAREQYRTIAIDISQRKLAEEAIGQAKKMETITTLAGGIAHDFNNLLYMIIGNTELALEDTPESNPVHDNLREIQTAGLRAAKVVKQLLNFSYKTDHELKSVDVVAIVTDVLAFLRSTIPATIHINKQLPKAPISILADPIQINQVMINICTNAFQAMEETGGVLGINLAEVTLGQKDAPVYPSLSPGNYAKITISDSGPGIPEKIISRLFDPYFTTREVGKGSGMGLSIAHGIVKSHGGDIIVSNQRGKGAVFTLIFPILYKIDEKPEAKIKQGKKLVRGTESILFVDDEPTIIDMNHQLLEQIGYQVVTRRNPEDALALFITDPQQFDLVITDMTMPQMTGTTLAKKLMKIRPDLPIIICTGHSELIDEKKAIKLGLAGYLVKPVSLSTMSKAIRKAIDGENKLAPDN